MADSDDQESPGNTAGQMRPEGQVQYQVAPTASSTVNRIRLGLWPKACWRMSHGMFAFDSSFVQPGVAAELSLLKARMDANAGCVLSIFGHADPSGEDSYNKKLSGRRARAMYGLLTHRVDIWEELYGDAIPGDTWGVKTTQCMLTRLVEAGDNATSDSDAVVSSTTSPSYDQSVRTFQAEHGLEVDGAAGPLTRQELYRCYMMALWPEPLGPERFLGDADGKAAYQGCGEHNPVRLLPKAEQAVVSAERNADNAPNRRVMIFLFDAAAKTMTAGSWPCPTWNEGVAGCRAQFWPDGDERRQAGDSLREYVTDQRTMACRFYDKLARLSPCEGNAPNLLHVSLALCRAETEEPLAQCAYQLCGHGYCVEGVTDENGCLEHPYLRAGDYEIRLAQTSTWVPATPLNESHSKWLVVTALDQGSKNL